MDQGVAKVFPTRLKHWGVNVGCVIDTETTGLDPNFHEIIQIAIIPFDINFNIVKDCLPFICNMRPDFPERIDPKAMSVNKKASTLISGVSQAVGADLLEDWFQNRLGVYATRNGARGKIMPLGQNYAFDMAFMKKWLGTEIYNSIFHYHYRDTMHAALYCNDHAAMNAEEPPFSKVSLTDLAQTFKVKHDDAHDAIADCKIALEVYKQMCLKGHEAIL